VVIDDNGKENVEVVEKELAICVHFYCYTNHEGMIDYLERFCK
jgi:ATP-dependent protease HslVU (ClpYQ) peptidase subunit